MNKTDKRDKNSYPQGLACIHLRGNRQYIDEYIVCLDGDMCCQEKKA